MTTDEDVYAGQVSEIIAAQPRESSYMPAKPIELFVRNRRTPTTIAELAPLEKKILERMFKGQDLAQVLIADKPRGTVGSEPNIQQTFAGEN